MFSCSATSENNLKETYAKISPYEIMDANFKGDYNQQEIKILLERVMTNHHMDITEENLMKCANLLIAIKNSSAIGITEMDVLKDMDLSKAKGLDFESQAAESFIFLENN